MAKLNHKMILDEVMEKYQKRYGEPGLMKADVDDLVYMLGGDKQDIYAVMIIGMEQLFGDVMEREQFLN